MHTKQTFSCLKMQCLSKDNCLSDDDVEFKQILYSKYLGLASYLSEVS